MTAGTVLFACPLPQSDAIDKETQKFIRHEYYEQERDRAHGVIYGDKILENLSIKEVDIMSRMAFWEVLADVDRETALVLVLRYCMGYSATEVAAGLNITYGRVRSLCSIARRKAEKREARIAAREARLHA
jgi:DNA-directed RNA polymerase specialized sigma24 family protein